MTTTTTTAPTANVTDTDAAALEDVLEAQASDLALYYNIIDLDAKIADLERMRDDARLALRESMESRGAQALTLRSRVISRISHISSSRIDAAALKKDLPDVAAKYLRITKSSRFTVTRPRSAR